MVQQNANLRIKFSACKIHRGDIHMKPNRQKEGECSPSVSRPKQTVSRPFKTPKNSITQIDKVSSGVNPIIHQCPMHRRKPLSKKEADIQLKQKMVFK